MNTTILQLSLISSTLPTFLGYPRLDLYITLGGVGRERLDDDFRPDGRETFHHVQYVRVA